MPTPSSSLATLRPELGTFMEFDLAASRMGFIGTRCLPVIEVAKQSGSFGVVKIESLLKLRDTKRAPGSGYSRQHYEFDDTSYATEEHGAEEPVDDREAEMYMDYFDAEVVAAQRALDVVVRNYEIRVAAIVQGVSNSTGITTDWTNHSTAVPLGDIEAAINTIRTRTGLKANAIAMGWYAFRNLRRCTEVQNLITAQGAGQEILPENINAQMLARVFDVEEVLVGDAMYDSANEGLSRSLANVWDPDKVTVFVKPMGSDIREPCLGRTFHWGADGSMMGSMVESYRDESVRSDIIRARMDTDELKIYDSCAQLLTGATS